MLCKKTKYFTFCSFVEFSEADEKVFKHRGETLREKSGLKVFYVFLMKGGTNKKGNKKE